MKHGLPVITILLAIASVARAQSNATPSQLSGFTAILLTPIGALPSIVPAQRWVDSSRGLLALRYGRYNIANSPTFNNVGLSGAVAVARRFRAGLTVGRRSCDVCEGSNMGSVDLSASLLHKPAARDIGGDTDIGLQLSVGMAKARTSDVHARSFALSVPLAVTLLQPESSLLTLFLDPSLAYGELTTNGVSDGASRFVIAAGVGYAFAFGVGAQIAAHKVVIEDGPTQLGFSLHWRFGGK